VKEFKSEIETNPKTGRKCLTVYYSSKEDDYDEAIGKAMAVHNIKDGQMLIIAMPG